MDVVKKNRRSLKGQITRIENHIAPFDRNNLMPRNDITVQMYNVDTLRKRCIQLLDECSLAATTDAEFTTEEPEIAALMERVDKIGIKLEEMVSATATTATTGTSELRLPKLEIPSFNGNVQDWLSFHDLFTASVHNNPKLSGGQKLQYLKAAVKDEPALLIQSLQVTDTNYAEAWKILEERYEDKREIVKANFERLLSQQNIQIENPALLQKLVDTTRECVRSLQIMKIPMEKVCELLLIHLTSKKLDAESRLQWERTLKRGELPTFKQFCEFLDQHARVTAAAKPATVKNFQKQNSPSGHPKQMGNDRRQGAAVHHGSSSSPPKCSYCGETHHIFKCEKFQSLSTKERWSAVLSKKLCFKCLSTGHRTDICKWKTCKFCNAAHKLLLHEDKPPHVIPQKEEISQEKENPVASLHATCRDQTLLSTAIIKVLDNKGNYQVCRALLDNGSDCSFVSSACATRLGIRRQKVQVPLTGLGESSAGTAMERCQLVFTSCYGNTPVYEISPLVVKKVTKDLPSFPVKDDSWPHLKWLKLADPHFGEPGKIDILLGGDVYFNLTLERKVEGPPGTPIATETHLGWILGGKLIGATKQNSVSTHLVQCDADETLKRFWELEEVPRKKFITAEEKLCEEHFSKTHIRDPSGRFVVRLPFKENVQTLGDSRQMAVKRLKQVERRLANNPALQEKYQEVLSEYLELQHMELVPVDELLTEKPTYYMPHHGVTNEASTTTKLRVVFDASATSTSGASLNKNLLVGPKLQEDLVSILIRFRQHEVALSADITKMYRQVRVHTDDVDFQRIVWRNSPTAAVQDYRLLTATFGTSAAPYLAVKCVQQLALEEKTNFPDASAVILRDFYVDDLMSGAQTEKEAIKLQQDLRNLLDKGGFELRKWSSNSEKVLASLPTDLCETNLPLSIDTDEGVKTLGLQWHPATDHFSFRVKLLQAPALLTKRTVLSEIAKVFDPLGWLSPVTISAKVIIQQLWREELGWDEPLPNEMHETWMTFREQLPVIGDVKIPRCITQANATAHELHGFCDASETAYAAVVFLRSICTNGDVTVNMVAAKSKVAPLKQVSLPRLELCGAILMVRLVQCIQEALALKIENTFGWTDSTIVLAWLNSPPQRWKTFVANRVSEIQDVIPAENWNHVRSEENPADCASRGISPSSLLLHTLWWSGPPWLLEPELRKLKPEVLDSSEIPEIKSLVKVHQVLTADVFLFKYSDLNRLIRVTAYCRKFILNARSKTHAAPGTKRKLAKPNSVPTLSNEDLDEALLYWIKIVQATEFPQEILNLKLKKEIRNKSRLKPLAPFLDAHGILRVGGRLKKSPLHSDAKHQILLPKNHHLTTLIIDRQHKRDLHSGPQLLLTALQQKYWIVSGRDVVRQFVRRCIKCYRFRAQVAQQQMGNLPTLRVTPAPPFQKCGVDYAGPFSLTPRKGRGQKSFKNYIAVFVCFVSHAIHLELVSDMTTDAFLAALHRFISRRGKPTDIHSDCGTNFVGAKNVLEDKKLQTVLSSDAIAWHLNPAASPQFGGIWESAVKSMKHHLTRVVGNAILTTEEMLTLLAQVEACLNSRPITQLSSDPNDLQPLTPGHFLIGRPLTALPEPDITHLKENHLSRWQRVQQLYQHFWKRWSTEHLSRLQQRNKWASQQENMKVGDIVLITDENLPPNKWKLGRISEAFPGNDGLVRAVTVKTSTGELKRPVVKLSILPIS